MNQMRIEFDGFEQVMARLKQLDADAKGAAEEALKRTHKIVTDKAADAVQDANLPAQGNYSTGATIDSLERRATVYWNASVATVDVGFHISKGGLPSVFMIKGTPKYMKNKKLWDAFYGKTTIDEYKAAQEAALMEELWRHEG